MFQYIEDCIGVDFDETRPLLEQQRRRSCCNSKSSKRDAVHDSEMSSPKGMTLLHLLVVFFGITAWLGINSTFVQLPLLVERAPESWSLPSFIVIMIQLGNLGPLLYTTLQKCQPFKDSPWITTLLVMGCIGSIIFAFYHTATATFLGAERSVALLSIVFIFALVGCTSSVLFMPYMGRFKEVYLVTYLIGEGLSGLVPSTVALIQGVGGNAVCVFNNATETYYPEYPSPRFGVQTFYLFVFTVYVISTIAFILLDNHPKFKDEYAAKQIKHGNDYSYDPEPSTSQATQTSSNQMIAVMETEAPKKLLSSANYVYLLLLLGFICMLINGVVPSVQSYSCLPYGNVAYHLSVTLSAIANPTACFLAFFVHHKSIRLISWLTVISMAFIGYAFMTALVSPPPLRGTWIGELFVVLSWTLLTGLHSFIRLAITSIFRLQGGKSLVWVGSMTQLGSCVGSILAFALINFTSLFKQYDPCQDFSG